MPQIPVLIKILVIFALVVAASARRVHLGVAALAGGWLFALWQGLPLTQIIVLTVRELLNPETVLLLGLVTAIMMLSVAMKKAGAMEDFAKSVSAVARSRNASLILTPVLIGTLPMPGGAAFSAPLVESLDPDRSLGAEGLSAANYWFRHSLELWWPLFPSFILTSTLTGFSVSRLLALNVYIFPVMTILGIIFILKGRGGNQPEKTEPGFAGPKPGFRTVLTGFAPLIFILGTYALMDAAFKVAQPLLSLDAARAAILGRYFPILSGVGAGSLYISLKSRGKRAFHQSLTPSTIKLAGVVAGIRVFSALLQAGGAAVAASSELAAAGIPPLVVAAVLPLVSGLVTGVGFGYVGLSLPIVLGLYDGGAFGAMALEPVVALVGAFGFAGMMISPLHVCMVVSAEHFHISLPQTIRRFAAPLGAFLVVALIYVAVLARLL